MSRFQRSWLLFKSSLRVMQRDPQLLLFPVLTTACTVLVALLFLAPVAFQPTGQSYLTSGHWAAVVNSLSSANVSRTVVTGADRKATQFEIRQVTRSGPRPLAVAYFAATYFASMFLATFFNVAFYREILKALNGEAVSIAAGLRFACTKWKAILMWTLFAGLVGYFIKMLEQRVGLIGHFILRLLGTAWSVACVFVIPVIITDENATNPFRVLKQSALTLKETWGESLIGYAGVSFGSALIFLGSMLWLGAGIWLSITLQQYWLIALVVLCWLTVLCAWAYVLGVASQIFRCALFLYAENHTLPAPYTQEMVEMAWKRKLLG